MRAPRDTSYEEALLPLLKDPQDAASHVETEMELDDPAALLVALHHVAKAHGMAEERAVPMWATKVCCGVTGEKPRGTRRTVSAVAFTARRCV